MAHVPSRSKTARRIPVDGVLVSNLDPKHTFLELVGADSLDETLRHACERWRYDVMSMFCVYLALDAPVRWKAAEYEPAVERCFAVSVCESLDVLDDNASDCRLGVPPRRPGLFTVHPSLFEPSLCPPGKEACFCEQIAPYDLREGGPRRGTTSRTTTPTRSWTGGGRTWRAGSSPKP